MFEAVYQGQVVIEGNRYFPPCDVEPQYLHRTRMKTLCPWQGVASYYTVQVHGASDRNAAWTYRHPSPLARSIKNHIAFWGNVTVRDTDVDAG